MSLLTDTQNLLKIQWQNSCSRNNIYNEDGYADHLFYQTTETDIIEPVYEIKRTADEKQGKTISSNVQAKKTYKLTLHCAETVADVINTLPLADTVYIIFPDGLVLTLTGDDITINFGETVYDKAADETIFKAEILFITDIFIKTNCCNVEAGLVPVAEDDTLPVITSVDTDGDTITVYGTVPAGYMARLLYKKMFEEITPDIIITKTFVSMTGELTGWIADDVTGKVYYSTDGFETLTLKYTAAGTITGMAASGTLVIVITTVGDTYRSANTGGTWSTVNVGAAINLLEVFIDNTQIPAPVVTVGVGGAIYLSGDLGLSYTAQNTDVPLADDLYAITSYNNRVVVGGDNGSTAYCDVSDYSIANTFTVVNSGATGIITCMQFTPTGKVFAATNGGEIVRSSDSGATYATISTGVYTKFTCMAWTLYHGLFIGGTENVVIDVTAETIRELLTTGGAGIILDASNFRQGSTRAYNCYIIKSDGSNNLVMSNLHEFTDGNECANGVIDGDGITQTLTNYTHIIALQAFTHQYEGAVSAEWLVIFG